MQAVGRCLQPLCGKAALWDCAAPRPPLIPGRARRRGFSLQGPEAPWLSQPISRHNYDSVAKPFFGFPGRLVSAKTQPPALPDTPGALGKPKKSQVILLSLILRKGCLGLTCPHLQDRLQERRAAFNMCTQVLKLQGGLLGLADPCQAVFSPWFGEEMCPCCPIRDSRQGER